MAICTICGAVLHKDNAKEHICIENEKPIKDIMHVNGKKIDIKTQLVIE